MLKLRKKPTINLAYRKELERIVEREIRQPWIDIYAVPGGTTISSLALCWKVQTLYYRLDILHGRERIQISKTYGIYAGDDCINPKSL